MKEMRQQRLRRLEAGKVKSVGLAEWLRLHIAGSIDGARGFPRLEPDGSWTSAFLNRELCSCEEFCCRMWAMLQQENEETFIRVRELTESIPVLRAQLAEAEEALLDAEAADSPAARKKGEESLTEDQVKARRLREKERKLNPLREKAETIRKQLAEETGEFIQLCSRLDEDGNTVRLSIRRVGEHMLQRLDVYWNAALRSHPESSRMCAVPKADIFFRAEDAYMALHRELQAKAEALQLHFAV